MSYALNQELGAKRGGLATSSNIDPVTAAIIRGGMETICFETCEHLKLAASSPIINQSNERNASLIDANGRLAAVSIGTPHLTFVSELAIRYGLKMYEDFDWGPGDVFVGNDPDYGGGHLPDYIVYAPAFDDNGELLLIQTLQAHQADTGGKDPGGFTLDATDIYTEGLSIPCLKLVHRGETRRDVVKMLERNNRFPSFHGDLAAMVSGVQLGVRLIDDLVRKWGADKIKAAINFNIERSERRLRDEVASWPDGTYEATVFIDHDTLGIPDVKVHASCTVKGDQFTVDLNGCDDRPELTGVWNTYGNTRSYVMTQIAAAIDPSIHKNAGLFDAVEMIIPEGTIVQPPPNKPAALGSFHPASELCEVMSLVFAQIVPERSSFQGYKIGMPNSVFGFDDSGRMWMDQGTDCHSMDSSAVQGIDGWGAGPAALGNLLLSQAEDAESRWPVINITRDIVIDKDGPGQWRGANGSRAVKKILAPSTGITWVVSAKHTLAGLNGGEDACAYENRFLVGTEQEHKIDLAAHENLPAGAVISMQFGGGSGFGPAFRRDPEQVRNDALDELISIERARDKYGVAFTGSVEQYDLAVDREATDALREKMAQAYEGALAA